jgi:hypothetical protein
VLAAIVSPRWRQVSSKGKVRACRNRLNSRAAPINQFFEPPTESYPYARISLQGYKQSSWAARTHGNLPLFETSTKYHMTVGLDRPRHETL